MANPCQRCETGDAAKTRARTVLGGAAAPPCHRLVGQSCRFALTRFFPAPHPPDGQARRQNITFCGQKFPMSSRLSRIVGLVLFPVFGSVAAPVIYVNQVACDTIGPKMAVVRADGPLASRE